MNLFERRPKGRLLEEKKAKEKHFDSSDIQNIRNRLGLRSTAPKEKIVFELNRLKAKSKATWDALKLTKEDFEKFGIVIPK